MRKSHLLHNFFLILIAVVVASVLLFVVIKLNAGNYSRSEKTQTFSLKSIDSQLMVDGSVRSQNESQLHFQTGGKLTYVPFKEGATVSKGQTIASLDTYTVQEQLQAAMNTYDSANQAYKQVKANSQDKVLKKQLTTPYDYYALAGLDGEDKKLAMQDAVDRLVQESKDAKNSAAIQVDLAKYAYTFSNITAPFNGILLHEDVTTPNVVVTPQTTFTVIDPNALVFRVIVSEDQINYVTEGAKATIKLNGVAKPTDGTVIKIYPDKLTLPDGENVYQVDIASNQLAGVAKYKQNGVAFITNIYDKQVLLVPTWLILDGSHVWVEENGQNVLKQVTTGNVNGAYTEITSGLSDSDKLITSPASIARKEYLFL